MARFRMEQINSEIQKAVSEIITNDLRNPMIDDIVVSVVKVTASTDLSQAKVYLGILATDEMQPKIFAELEASKGFIRKQLASKLNLRKTPALIFIYDESIEEGARIISLLKDIKDKGSL